MNAENPLEFIKKEFRQAGLDCEIVQVDDNKKTRLLVFLGTDHQDRGMTLEVTVQDMGLERELFSSKAFEEHASVRIQFDTTYAFPVQEEALVETSEFLHFINLQMELPGFYLDPLENRIVYRYVWLCNKKQIDPQLALNIVGIIMFFQASFATPLERVASGKQTYLDLMEEILGLEQ